MNLKKYKKELDSEESEGTTYDLGGEDADIITASRN